MTQRQKERQKETLMVSTQRREDRAYDTEYKKEKQGGKDKMKGLKI